MKQKKQKLQILKCRIPCTWELLHKVKELGLTVLTIVTKDHSFKIVSKSKYLIEFVNYKYFKIKPLTYVFKVVKKMCGRPVWNWKMSFSRFLCTFFVRQEHFKFQWLQIRTK